MYKKRSALVSRSRRTRSGTLRTVLYIYVRLRRRRRQRRRRLRHRGVFCTHMRVNCEHVNTACVCVWGDVGLLNDRRQTANDTRSGVYYARRVSQIARATFKTGEEPVIIFFRLREKRPHYPRVAAGYPIIRARTSKNRRNGDTSSAQVRGKPRVDGFVNDLLVSQTLFFLRANTNTFGNVNARYDVRVFSKAKPNVYAFRGLRTKTNIPTTYYLIR